MKSITGIGHVAIRVKDIGRTLDFYVGKLGFSEMMRLDRDGRLWLLYLRITDDQYLEIFPEAVYFLNSVVISFGSTAIALALAISAAYGFARIRFRGKPFLEAFVLVGQLLPTAAIIVPLYVVLSRLGLINTYLDLILVYLILTLPLSVWMLIGYFSTIPIELEEATIVDGCSRLGVLLRVTLPLSMPGVVPVVIYAFVATWNEFIFALCLATDSRSKTLPIGLSEFSTEFNTDWGAVMAASVIMTLPICILFFALQKLFIGGLVSGATKG
jgi:multiple sugar transport system permease protein